MRILVTGGAGFIGSNYVRRVIDGSLPGITSITILDKLTYAGTLANLSGLPADSFRFVRGDICDASLVSELTKGQDAVINFAAESHVDNSIVNSAEFVQTNILGTQTLLDAGLRNNIQTFIQVSTDEVYGSISKGSWKESEPLLPNSPYAATKASADLISRAFYTTYGFDVRITRCSNNYGPHQYPEKIIPLFVTNLIRGKKIPIYGSGINVRDWLHVDDHCRGIHSVLIKGAPGEIYNIGGGTELTNIELTSQILRVMGMGDDSIIYVNDRLGHDIRYSVDATKIWQQLGFRPSVRFENGLQSTIQWYLQNESWWRAVTK